MSGPRRRPEPVSIALVVAQFALIAILASPLATLVPTGPAGWLGARLGLAPSTGPSSE